MSTLSTMKNKKYTSNQLSFFPSTVLSRHMNLAKSFLILALICPLNIAIAQTLDNAQGAVEVSDPDTAGGYPNKGAKPGDKVGRKSAEKYMAPKNGDKDALDVTPNKSARSSQLHYLAMHFGFFLSDNAYKWGTPESQSNAGRWNLGVTYRVGEWVNSMDLGIRVDIASYNLVDGNASKLSFLPVVMFPDATSKFPLYFGAGAGLGVFMKQLSNESALSLDYQLFGGVRFFEVIQSTGFFVEGGIKNHFLLLSDGQFNGTYFAVGSVFSF